MNPEDKISIRYLLGFKIGDFRKNQYKILKEKAIATNISIREVLDSVLRGDIPDTNIRAITTSYRSILNDLTNLKESLLADPEKELRN